jgi:hypothetical protein
MKLSNVVRLIVAHGDHRVGLVKVKFHANCIIALHFRCASEGEPDRLEHFTYPADGRGHISVEDFINWPDDRDPDPLDLYDINGKKPKIWRPDRGPPLSAFVGRFPLVTGYTYLSINTIDRLPELRDATQPHDVTISAGEGGDEIAYTFDLVGPGEAAIEEAIKFRRLESESVGERFYHQIIDHTQPRVLVGLRGKHLSDQKQ